MKKKNKSFRVVNKIKKLLLEKNLLQPQQSLVVTISGGQDSIFLFILLFLIKKQWKLSFSLLYCNHLWNEKSLYTYSHIFKLAYCFQIEIFYSIPSFFLSSEEESRYWRSKNYSRFNQFLKSSTIVTGHTLTDQIETFFFNTFRGSSIQSSYSLKIKRTLINKEKNNFSICEKELKNLLIIKKRIKVKQNKINFLYCRKNIFLKSKKKITNVYFFEKRNFQIIPKKSFSFFIIRPLLSLTRFDIKNICINFDLPIFPDPTNENLKYSRNRLRKQILPSLRNFFNRKLDFSLYRYIEISSEEEIISETFMKKIIKEVLYENEIGFFFNLGLISSFPLAIQRKILLFFFKSKLKIRYNFLKINYILFLINNRVYKNQRKDFSKKEYSLSNYCVFPEIGIMFISKSFFMFLK